LTTTAQDALPNWAVLNAASFFGECLLHSLYCPLFLENPFGGSKENVAGIAAFISLMNGSPRHFRMLGMEKKTSFLIHDPQLVEAHFFFL